MPILKFEDRVDKAQAAVGHEDLQLSQFVQDRLVARVSYAQIVTELVSDFGVSIGYAHSVMDSVKQAMDAPLAGERFKVIVPGGSDGDAMSYVGQTGTVSLSSDGQVGLEMDDGTQLVYPDAATFALGTEKAARTFTETEVRERGRAVMRAAPVAERWWLVSSAGQDYVVTGPDRTAAVDAVTGGTVGPKFKDKPDYGVTARGPYKSALAACGVAKRAFVVIPRGKRTADFEYMDGTVIFESEDEAMICNLVINPGSTPNEVSVRVYPTLLEMTHTQEEPIESILPADAQKLGNYFYFTLPLEPDVLVSIEILADDLGAGPGHVWNDSVCRAIENDELWLMKAGGKRAGEDNTDELKKEPGRVRVMIEDALLNYQVDGTILDGEFGGGVEVAVPTGDEQDMRELLDGLGLMYSEDTSQDLITIFKVTGGRGRADGLGTCF